MQNTSVRVDSILTRVFVLSVTLNFEISGRTMDPLVPPMTAPKRIPTLHLLSKNMKPVNNPTAMTVRIKATMASSSALELSSLTFCRFRSNPPSNSIIINASDPKMLDTRNNGSGSMRFPMGTRKTPSATSERTSGRPNFFRAQLPKKPTTMINPQSESTTITAVSESISPKSSFSVILIFK